MTNLHFPIYSYRSLSEKDLKYVDPEKRGDLIRYDYFDLTKVNKEDKQKFYLDLQKHYEEIYANGIDYKDYLLYRYFFKDFVIRETTDDNAQTRFYKFSLSEWDQDNKEIGYDDRTLTADTYSEYGDEYDGLFVKDMSLKLKVGHKDDIIRYVNGILDRCENDHSLIAKENLYLLPLYFSGAFSKEYGFNKYIRISELQSDMFKTYTGYDNIYDFLSWIPQALCRFCVFNMYMLEKTEENEDFNFLKNDNIISDNLISYIKTKAKHDKRVTIDMGKEIKLRMKLDRKNIYTHNNHIVRTLCDYKFQVSAHWHHYWIGSRKNHTQEKICKWVEAYYKNPDKEFRIIKERVNMA